MAAVFEMLPTATSDAESEITVEDSDPKDENDLEGFLPVKAAVAMTVRVRC